MADVESPTPKSAIHAHMSTHDAVYSAMRDRGILSESSLTAPVRHAGHFMGARKALAAGFLTFTSVVAAACGGAGGDKSPSTPTNLPPKTPDATARVTPTASTEPTFNISTPNSEYTPGAGVIPLTELLNPAEWPNPVTNKQLEDAINSVQGLDATTKYHLANRIIECESGMNGDNSPTFKTGACNALGVSLLKAWNKGDPNAPAAFGLIYAFEVAPKYGFAQDSKAQIDAHYKDVLNNLNIPFN